MSVTNPSRTKTQTPTNTLTQTPTTTLAPGLTRGGTTNVPQQRTAGLPQLIQEQPLPTTNTDQYNQYMAALNAAMQQQQTYGTQVLGLQNQLNALQSQDKVSPYLQQMMSLYRQDPTAAIHQQMMEMQRYNAPQNMAYYMWGY